MPRPRGRTSSGYASSHSRSDWASSRWARARTTASPPRRERPMSVSGRRSSATAARATAAKTATWPKPRCRNRPVSAVTLRATMGFADVWNKTLVYFGIAEEEEWDEDGYLTDEELQRADAEQPHVRLLTPRNVEVSAEERARMLERGGFFNQA